VILDHLFFNIREGGVIISNYNQQPHTHIILFFLVRHYIKININFLSFYLFKNNLIEFVNILKLLINKINNTN